MKTRNAAMLRHLAARVKPRPFPVGRGASVSARHCPRLGRLSVLVVFAAVAAAAFFSSPSASSSHRLSRGKAPKREAAPPANPAIKVMADKKVRAADLDRLAAGPDRSGASTPGAAGATATWLAPTLLPTAESITIPQLDFNLGDTVNVIVAGALGQRLNWVDPSGVVRASLNVTTDPQTFMFTIPATATSSFNGLTIDNRGTWRVTTLDADAVLRASTPFTIHSSTPVADLVVYKSVSTSSDLTVGGTITTKLWVTNVGPDAAQNVVVTDTTPANTTFVSATQDAGPAFSCTTSLGTTNCTIASLDKGAKATFTVLYQVTSTASDIVNTANITSDTPERDATDNTSTPKVLEAAGGGGGGGTCTLTCPADIVQNVDTGQDGANVTYTATTSGSCGTVSYDPPSGSFFPLGTTLVTATDGTGASCSFTVTVREGLAITIRLNPSQLTCHDETTGAPVPCPPSPLTVECHTSFTDPGATAQNGLGTTFPVTTQVVCSAPDPNDPNQEITVPCSFDVNRPGVYTFIYTATDGGANTATTTRRVNVVDTTPPVIALVGASPLTVECHTSFTDPGASAVDACVGSVAVTSSGSVNVNATGTYTITYTATDGTNTGTATRTVTVVDTTPPVITLNGASTITVECHTSFTDLGATATDTCAGSFAATASGNVNTNVPGTYTITYSAKDPSGNAATPITRTVNVVDTTAPVISCPGNISVMLPANSTATATAVNFTVTATDACSGPTVPVTSQASGSLFPVGTTTVTATATDAAGNHSTCSFTVTVLYNFTGFFSPVANLPVLNTVNAGRSVPVKFSLSGNKGLGVFAATYPASGPIACDANAPAVDLAETTTAGESSLSYDPASDQYTYVWKTDAAWAGTCRQLVIMLNDGTVHRANFKFR